MSHPPRPDPRVSMEMTRNPTPSLQSAPTAPQLAAARPGTAPTPLKPAATTPQQVAAAAAALAASRAASVSAAVRSVFGVATNVTVNNNSSATAAAAAARTATTAAAIAAAAAQTKPTIMSAPTPTNATTTTTASSVVVQSAFDGLLALASHTASCHIADADTNVCVPRDGDVSLYGEPSTRACVRTALLQFYSTTNQVPTQDKTPTPTTNAITEMTLRIDTELEMLRRQCFAERNARWQNQTPDMFSFRLASQPPWTPAPYVGPRKKMLLYRKRLEHQRLRSDSERVTDAASMGSSSSFPQLESDLLLQSLLGVELVRDRPWPPKEFVAKATTKPSRGGGNTGSSGPRTSAGKKKALGMVGVVDETPTQSLVCSECATQRSALWRKRPRRQLNGSTPAPATSVLATTEQPVAVDTNASSAAEVLEDVCLPCFMKTERRDLFDKKAAEKIRLAKENAARAAAEARQQKKQQQQLRKKMKKMAPTAFSSTVQAVKEEVESIDGTTTTTTAPLTVDIREDTGSLRLKFRRESLSDTSVLASATTAAATFTLVTEEKKKKDKKSKKDKKKKKKKDKKKKKSEWDDSESDDDGAASSVILPSPPQRQMDGFVYADRTVVVATTTVEATESYVKTETVLESDSKSNHRSSSSSNKRQSSSTSRGGSSKKRKTTIDESDAAPVAPPPTTPSSSRNSRAKASTAAAPATTSPAAATKKRTRSTKKEAARERELRALGQYCPVCNLTYEEDDASPFVCCDSCEMWIHAACDLSLTPEVLATLTDATVKYTCPLCSGR